MKINEKKEKKRHTKLAYYMQIRREIKEKKKCSIDQMTILIYKQSIYTR